MSYNRQRVCSMRRTRPRAHILTTLGAELGLLDLEKLVAALLGGDAVNDEAALDIVENAEVLAGLLDGDNVHEAGGVGGLGADLAVNLDQALSGDRNDLAAGKSVLQAVTQKDDQRKGLTDLVRARGRAGCIGTGQLVEHPGGWGGEPLHVLSGTTDLSGGELRGGRHRVKESASVNR